MKQHPYLIGVEPEPISQHIAVDGLWGGAWAMLIFGIYTYVQGQLETVARFGGAVPYVIGAVAFFLLGAVLGALAMYVMVRE